MSALRYPSTPPIAAPSILSADFTKLDRELAIIDPARDWVHCDVMDGHFVRNLTFGPMVVGAVRRMIPRGFLDVHLMIERPERQAEAFIKAGANQITVHIEACERPVTMIEAVHFLGRKIGLAIKPGTDWALAKPFLDKLDLLLIMTVEPGQGGQAFMPDMLAKVEEAKRWREANNQRFLIEVDGGIGPDTAALAARAGADVFVAGHAVFRQPEPSRALEALRDALQPQRQKP